MAYSMAIPAQWIKTNPNTAKLSPFYNLDSTVGFNGVNRQDDVLLVQWLLNIWGGAWYSGKTGVTNLESFIPTMNGILDGVTVTWIMMYQMTKRSYLPKPDGVVKPVSAALSPASPNTLMLLNGELKAAMGHVPLASNPPTPLRLALQTAR